jgi:hypothetical protein
MTDLAESSSAFADVRPHRVTVVATVELGPDAVLDEVQRIVADVLPRSSVHGIGVDHAR